MPPLTWDHAIVALIVGLATVYSRWGTGRNNKQTDEIYHAVNSGRMERIEADLKMLKKVVVGDEESPNAPNANPGPAVRPPAA